MEQSNRTLGLLKGRYVKNLFAIIGCVTFILGLLGSCGIGNFVYMYSDKSISCIKEAK